MQRFIAAFLNACLIVPPVSTNTLSFIHQRHKWISTAMTLVELIVVMAMIGTVVSIGVPTYTNYIDKVHNSQAIEDIRFIEAALKVYRTDHGTFPDTLDQVPLTQRLDPWNHPYGYFRIEGRSEQEKQQNCRHLGYCIPLNNDFDLYSMGKNGKTNRNLPAKKTRDDIIRLHDGAYVGLVSEY